MTSPAPHKSAPPGDRRHAAASSPAAMGAPAMTSIAWLIPGAAHLLLGQTRKGIIFFAILTAMFLIGGGLGGRLFPFQFAEPLVFLMALAEWGVGLPRLLAALVGYGQGIVVATTYEYGNTFFIGAGLLNALVVLDAYDLATGRKPR
jgi:hypothetical protein